MKRHFTDLGITYEIISTKEIDITPYDSQLSQIKKHKVEMLISKLDVDKITINLTIEMSLSN